MSETFETQLQLTPIERSVVLAALNNYAVTMHGVSMAIRSELADANAWCAENLINRINEIPQTRV